MASELLDKKESCKRWLNDQYQANHAKRIWNYLEDFFNDLEKENVRLDLDNPEESKKELLEYIRHGMSQEVNTFSIGAYRRLMDYLLQEFPTKKDEVKEIKNFINRENFPEITKERSINKSAEERAEKYRKKVIEKDTLKKAFNKSGSFEELVLRGLYDTGCRIGEFVALKRKDLDFESDEADVVIKLTRSWTQNDGIQHTLKTSESRRVIGGEEFAELLKNYLSDNEIGFDQFIFYPKLARSTVYRHKIPEIIENVFSDINTRKEKINPHDFRHTRATQLVNENKNYAYISQYLGHNSPNHTMAYTHIEKEVPEHIASVNEKKGEREEAPLDKLERLEELRSNDVITDEEFENKKSELLNRI